MQFYLNKFKASRLLEKLALVLLVLNVGLLIWYQFDGYQAQFHSDSAHRVLLGNEVFKSGSIFPSDWSYVNRDLYILYGHLLVAPLMVFMKPGYLAYAISGVLNALIFLLASYLLLKELKVSKSIVYLTLAVICAGISGFVAENLFGQITYGNIITISMYVLLMVFGFIFGTSSPRKHLLYGSAYFLLILLVVASNPFRGFVYYVLPLILALGILGLGLGAQVVEPIMKQRALSLVMMTVGAVIAGIPLHLYILGGVNNIQGTSTALWLTYEQSISNIVLTGKGLLAIMGGAPTPGIAVASSLGLYEALRLIAAMMLLLLIPLSIRKSFKVGDMRMRIFITYALTAFAIVLFVQVFTTVPVMSDPVISSRYLVPPLFLLLICAFIRPSFDGKNVMVVVVTIAVMIFAALMAYPNYFRSYVNSAYYADGSNERSRRVELLQFLKANDLSYGYASYWNAGMYSVLSDGDVLVRQVLFENGIPVPYRHHAADSWYYSRTWTGKSFLLLTPDERKLVNVDTLSKYGVRLVSELQHAGYVILVFEKNLALGLPGWDLTYEHKVEFKASENSMKQIGRFVVDEKSGRPLLESKPKDIGALHFGPYIRIVPGKYRVVFGIDAFTADRDVIRIEVSTAPGEKVMADRILKSTSGQGEVLEFEVKKQELIEFRVWALGGAALRFSGVSIEQIP
ncbi:hypothetical protein G7048_06850 [Diaphorobacter sp. HDW4B]|uniref:hypothetical protein n=1 Tax=Diaphorobacter sp. HDW4B TaxID=2714925 RepID=UPI00140B1695|nr:hypothetical protein [Diaphorobacter sp. HDW4B]QIL70091.1 hypothetical protein G7048_06850 [Diaphorobacter sp. HDW4B]